MINVTLMFDGGLKNTKDHREGNPYGSFIFYVNEQPTKIYRWVDTNIFVTSNESEYMCLAKALSKLCNIRRSTGFDINVLTIQGDSKLLRDQVGTYDKGIWEACRCNLPHLILYRDGIRSLLLTLAMSFNYVYQHRSKIVKVLGH